MIVLTLAYHTVEYNDAVDEISTNILRMGGRLEDIYAEFLSIRNSATFINNFTVDDSMNRTDLAKSQRISFSAPDFITTVRRMRNNSIPTEQVGRYLFVLIKQLSITNAQLRNFASLANKFNTFADAHGRKCCQDGLQHQHTYRMRDQGFNKVVGQRKWRSKRELMLLSWNIV